MNGLKIAFCLVLIPLETSAARVRAKVVSVMVMRLRNVLPGAASQGRSDAEGKPFVYRKIVVSVCRRVFRVRRHIGSALIVLKKVFVAAVCALK